MKDKHTASPQSGSYEPDWLPVSAYLIEHPKGKFLVDTGWAREMSPNGEFDKKAQIKSLGTVMLYEVNQGRIGLGQCIDEQLLAIGIRDSDLDAVLLIHLDCDHANGLVQLKGDECRRQICAAVLRRRLCPQELEADDHFRHRSA